MQNLKPVGYGQTSMPIGQQSGMVGMLQPQQQMSVLTAPTFSLSQTNSFRYDKVESLSDENTKKLFKDIEKAFKDNSNYLDNAETYVKEISNYYSEFFLPAGNEAINYSKITISKKASMNYIIETLISEIEKEYHFAEKAKRNYSRLNNDPTKIVIPSNYFFHLLEQIEETIKLQIQQASHIEAIMNLHLSKEYGSFSINTDILEETIAAIYQNLLGLATGAAKINETLQILTMNYINYMKTSFRKSEEEIENHMRKELERIEKGHFYN
jgi:hypothetical protein